MWERSIDVANNPKTTNDTLSNRDDPRPAWLRAIRWILKRWWIIPLTCVIIYVLYAAFNLYQLSSHGGFQASYIFEALQLPTFLRYWWIVVLSLIALIVLIFIAFYWADSDETNELGELRKRRQR